MLSVIIINCLVQRDVREWKETTNERELNSMSKLSGNNLDVYINLMKGIGLN